MNQFLLYLQKVIEKKYHHKILLTPANNAWDLLFIIPRFPAYFAYGLAIFLITLLLLSAYGLAHYHNLTLIQKTQLATKTLQQLQQATPANLSNANYIAPTADSFRQSLLLLPLEIVDWRELNTQVFVSFRIKPADLSNFLSLLSFFPFREWEISRSNGLLLLHVQLHFHSAPV